MSVSIAREFSLNAAFPCCAFYFNRLNYKGVKNILYFCTPKLISLKKEGKKYK